MATTTTTTTTAATKSQQPIPRPKRRKSREAAVSAAACDGATSGRKQLDPPIVASSSDTNSWCCPASSSSSSSKPISTPTRLPDPELSHSFSSSSSSFRIRLSPGSSSPVMDFSVSPDSGSHSIPSSFTKFNTALTAGLLNPMSPPRPENSKAAAVMARSSPTLFEMMANEPEAQTFQPRMQNNKPQHHLYTNGNTAAATSQAMPMTVQDRQSLILHRISDILGNRSPGNLFNDSSSSDVKLTLSSKDGISVSMNVHRQILVAHSRFFAVKLSGKGPKGGVAPPCSVEIADCDDVEVYIETLRLMYCKDLRRKLMREDVSRVLGILKVSAAIGFDAGVLSCLEFLEAAPWAEDEEQKVASLLAELRLEGVGAGEVLKRVSVEVTNGVEENGNNEEVLLKLLSVVLEGKDEKARREMKGLVSKMLRENSSQNDIRKESLYTACDGCLQLLRNHFLQAASGDLQDVSQIARQADNLHWILDILIDRQVAEDFLKTWAAQSDLSDVHSKIPAVHRHEVSRVTARLFVGVGKGQVLASKESRCLLLQTWLVPFYDDFSWMRRASKGLDRHLIEDGLSNTILTLPLAWQQEFLLSWFNRFLNSGEDCPNIQRGFEVWWRRAFWKRSSEQESVRPLRITTATLEKS